jgi:Tol biopolymer transport system component
VNEDEGKRLFRVAVISTENPSVPKFYNVQASRLVVRWSNDGSAFEYIVNDAEGAKIWRQPLNDKQPISVVVDLPKAFLHNFLWSPDGEKLVVSRGLQANDAILLTNF